MGAVSGAPENQRPSPEVAARVDGVPPDSMLDSKPDPKPAPLTFTSGAVSGLFVLGLFYTAYFARAILIPITMALILSLVLAPLMRVMSRRLRIPAPISATLVVFGLAVALGFGVSALSKPAAEWMDTLPSVIAELERKLMPIGGTVKEVQNTARQVEAITETAEGQGGDKPVTVVVRGPSLAGLFLGQTMIISVGILVMAALLLFLLAGGDSVLRQAVAIAPNLSEKKRVVEIARETEGDISRYLASISVINGAVGIAVGGAMWLLGMPNPALWGAMAGLFNFVPFIGGLASVVIITLVSIVTFDSAVMIALPPLAYMGIHLLESQIFTPLIVSRRLLLSPIAILLFLIVWTWMWGIPGTLLAVPILATFKIVCERIDRLKPLAMLLTHQRPQMVDKA